jgi:antitoxin component YwqK of YwqJK toxin-antitoxin module
MPYVNGELEGLVQFYNENVEIRRSTYLKGLLHGKSTDFDAQGGVVQECHYEANVLQGPLRRFWPDGELMELVVYRDAKPVGAPKRHDAKGRETEPVGATPGLLDRLQHLVRGD